MSGNLRRTRLQWVMAGFVSLAAAFIVAMSTSGMAAQSRRSGNTSAESTPTTSSFTATNATGDPKRGRELFVKDACYQCHGYEGQGGAGTAGPRLGPDPMPPEAMAAVIRKDNGMMPPFSKTLVPDQDIVDIVAFLRTVSKPTDIKNIPDFQK